MEAIRRQTRPARGQAQVEYALILALISITASIALFGLGAQIPGVFAQVNSALGGQEECRGNKCGKPGNPDPGPPDAPKPGNPNPGDPNAPKPGNPNPGQPKAKGHAPGQSLHAGVDGAESANAHQQASVPFTARVPILTSS